MATEQRKMAPKVLRINDLQEAMEAHIFNPCTQETEAGGSLELQSPPPSDALTPTIPHLLILLSL